MKYVIARSNQSEQLVVIVSENANDFRDIEIVYGPAPIPGAASFLFSEAFHRTFRGDRWSRKIHSLAEAHLLRGWEYADATHEVEDPSILGPAMSIELEKRLDEVLKGARDRSADSMTQNPENIKRAFRELYSHTHQARLVAAPETTVAAA